MKRLTLFSLALAMCLLCTGKNAQAVDFKVNGAFIITGENLYSEKGLILIDKEGKAYTTDDNMFFHVEQYLLLNLQAQISESIKMFNSIALPNEQRWGNFELNSVDEKYNDVYSAHGDGVFALKESYVQFPLAMFDVKAGLQKYQLPNYLGSCNPVIGNWSSLTGFVATTDLGIVKPTLAWFIVDPETNKSNTSEYNNATKQNAFSLVLEAQLSENMSLNPWFVFNDMEGLASQSIGGITFDANMNNLVFSIGGIYAMDDSDNGANMLVSANASMDLGFATPGIALSYGIQDNKNILNGVANGIGVGGSGYWGNFNNSGVSIPGFMSGLQRGVQTSYNPFDSALIAITLTDISLSNTISLGLAGTYRLDTLDDGIDKEDEWTFSARGRKVFTRNMFFNLDATIAERENYGVYYGGLMTSVAGTLIIAF